MNEPDSAADQSEEPLHAAGFRLVLPEKPRPSKAFRMLSVYVAPLLDETTASWIEHAARELHTAPAALTAQLGLSLTRAHLGVLTPDEQEQVETIARLGPGTLPLGRHPLVRQWSGPADRVAWCPACLTERDARWSLAWTLPWTLVCTHHQVELVEVCPLCDQAPRKPDAPYVEQITPPGTCHRRDPNDLRLGRSAPRCLAPLTDAPARPATSQLVAAQRWIDETLTVPAMTFDPEAETTLAGVRIPLAWAARDLLTLSLSLGEERHDGDGHGREDGMLTPASLRRLHAVASQSSLDDVVSAWLLTGASPPTLDRLQSRLSPGRHSPWLHAVALRHDRPTLTHRNRLSHRADAPVPILSLEHFAHSRPGPDWPLVSSTGVGTPVFIHDSHLPSTLWEPAVPGTCDLGRLDNNDTSRQKARMTLSMALLVSGRARTWQQVAEALDLPDTSVRDAARLLSVLGDQGQLDTAMSRIQELVAYLSANPPPICYWRRRRQFTVIPGMTRRLERRVWVALGIPFTSKHRAFQWSGLLETRLAEILTGSDQLHLLLDTSRRIQFRKMRNKYGAELDEALAPLGERLLLRHRLDEPLTWSPLCAPDGTWGQVADSDRRLPGWNEPSYVFRTGSRAFSDNGRGSRQRLDLPAAVMFDSTSRERVRIALAHIEQQNARAAARQLGVDPAVVIPATTWLQEHSDEALFTRTSHRREVRLTLAGRRFINQLQRTLAAADRRELNAPQS